MIRFLEEIRTSENTIKTSQKIMNTLGIFILGIVLGIFSKYLDNLSLYDNIWWHRILEIIDLRNVLSLFGVWILIAVCISVFSKTPVRAGINVFLFFLGMNVSYHIYTIVFAGFNPANYMMIWYGVTFISPFMAFICWYAKGNGIISLMIDIDIIAVMILCSFSIGIWYFYFTNIINSIFFIITLIVLYENPKKTLLSLIGGIILAYLIRFFV